MNVADEKDPNYVINDFYNVIFDFCEFNFMNTKLNNKNFIFKIFYRKISNYSTND